MKYKNRKVLFIYKVFINTMFFYPKIRKWILVQVPLQGI